MEKKNTEIFYFSNSLAALKEFKPDREPLW